MFGTMAETGFQRLVYIAIALAAVASCAVPVRAAAPLGAPTLNGTMLPIERTRTAAEGTQLQTLLRQVEGLLEAGRLVEAEALLKQADAMARRIGSSGGVILVQQFQAELFMKQGRMDLAEAAFKNVIAEIGRRSGRTSPFLISRPRMSPVRLSPSRVAHSASTPGKRPRSRIRSAPSR
jgi:hypothetical protein